MKIVLLLGGPSMKDVDFTNVRADAFVGVNWAFLKPQVNINVVCDYRLMDRILSDYDPNKDGVPAVTHFKNWIADGGINIFVDHCQKKTHYYLTTTVKSTFPEWPKYPKMVEDGLYCRNNVGISGLHAACLLMPNFGEIDIYGMDMRDDTPTGKTENWHEHHDPRWAQNAKDKYANMRKAWDAAVKLLPPGIKIRNMNKDSGYRGFAFP